MKVLVTGFTGSLGTIVTKKLLDSGHEVVGLSRDELKQSQSEDHPRLTKYLCDVRNKDRLVQASRGVQLLFHFAALKRVDTLENNPEEAIETNVVGTMNVLHAQRVNAIPKVVLSSTDKAVFPINTYGMTKAIAEKLVLRNQNNCVCRYGNVLASRGSVVHSFLQRLKEGKPIGITDHQMSRFWITLDQASDFVLSCRDKQGLQIPPMKAARVTKIAEVVADIAKANGVNFESIGIRPGEKLFEFIDETTSSESVPKYQHEELRAMISPIVEQCQMSQ